MHRLLITALACLISVSVVGQTTILDEKKGFRDIKLGTSVSEYSFITKCDSHWGCGYYYFKKEYLGSVVWNQRESSHPSSHTVDIEGSGYNQLGPFPIRKIYIETDNNDDIIIEIRLVLETEADVYSYLYNIFGPEKTTPLWTAYKENSNDNSVWMIWQTESISMQLDSKHLDGNKHNRIIGYTLSFEDRALTKKKDDEEKLEQEKRRQETINTQF